MLERLPKFQRNVGLALVAVLIGWAAWTIRDVLNPLILGYLLAYILRPYVLVLEKTPRTGTKVLASGGTLFIERSEVARGHEDLAADLDSSMGAACELERD